MTAQRRILWVDDEISPFQRDMEGYDVTCVGDLKTAMERLRDEPYDAVVTDLVLPGGGEPSLGVAGIRLLEFVRKEDNLATLNDVPIIVYSMAAERALHNEGVRGLATLICQKSDFTFTELIDAISELLEN